MRSCDGPGALVTEVIPGPEDELSQGLWENHLLFSPDYEEVAAYARYVTAYCQEVDGLHWEGSYAAEFLELRAVIENERRVATLLALRDARRSLEDAEAGAGYLFDTAIAQGVALGALLTRWRFLFPQAFNELDRVLWSAMQVEILAAPLDKNGAEILQPYVLAKKLAEVRDSGDARLGQRLRQAGCPSEDAIGRRLSQLRKAHRYWQHPPAR